eukprot:jgi/Psemu1/58306/gm1.58306_g
MNSLTIPNLFPTTPEVATIPLFAPISGITRDTSTSPQSIEKIEFKHMSTTTNGGTKTVKVKAPLITAGASLSKFFHHQWILTCKENSSLNNRTKAI